MNRDLDDIVRRTTAGLEANPGWRQERVGIQIRAAVQEAYDLALASAVEMRLCEVPHLILKPQMYHFTVDPKCIDCVVAEAKSR